MQLDYATARDSLTIGDHAIINGIIFMQPTDAEAAIGEKFAVSVEAEGEGLTYQWYYKDSYMTEFKISSFKSSSYAMTMASYQNNRQVYCVITDAFGNQITTEVVGIYITEN